MAPERVERKLAAILSADVVGYSRLMAEDEASTIHTLGSYREQIGVLVREHRGRVVDSPGDNVLAELPTALEAVHCAVEIQGVLRVRNASLPADRRMDFRIGVHMGDVATEGERIYGDGVNIAARLEALAEAGGICISAAVHEQVRNKLDLGFMDLGDQTVKNIPDPVRVYRVQLPAQGEARIRAKATPVKRPGRRTALVATAVALLLLGMGLWASWPAPLGLLIDLAGVSGPPVNPPLPDKPSIVVLPFVNMSGDPEQEYFSDGITEELTTDLSRNPNLFVISRNSAFTYKGQPVKVKEVGRELGVRYVLEGSVRRDAERLRITAQLIDATTGGHLWSERYDRDLEYVLALQAEISEKIQSRLRVEVFGAEVDRVQRISGDRLTAYDLHSKAIYHFVKWTRPGMERARELARRSMELDPSLTNNYTLLGGVSFQQYAAGWDLDRAHLSRAESLARRALELDERSGWANVLLANIHIAKREFEVALRFAERAVEIDPNYEFAHVTLALSLAGLGRVLEAVPAVNRALRLNPLKPTPVLTAVGYVNYLAGRKQRAAEAWEQVRAANPERLGAQVPLAWHYEVEGHHEEARAVVEGMLRINPDLTADAVVEWLGAGGFFGGPEAAKAAEALRRAGLP
jgi:TolB-like protein/class 3 adenylate cyclase